VAARPEVVVTGVGVALPLGLDVDHVRERSLRGESAIGPLRHFEPGGFACRAAAEVPAFELSSRLRCPKNEKFMGRSLRCAMHAARQAVEASRLDAAAVDPYRLAVYTGSGQTGLESAEFFRALEVAQHPDEQQHLANLGGRPARVIDRYFSLRTLSNAGVGLLSVELGAQGSSDNLVQGETASALAVAAGYRDLLEQRSDAVIVGGYDSLLGLSAFLGYAAAGLLSPAAHEHAYRPFDRDRDGIVLGEGAAFLVLERGEDARRRGAPLLGEVLGVGDGMALGGAGESERALRRAVEQATGGAPMDFVVAHGVGTRDGDRDEAQALAALFGERLPVTAFKSQTGYLGAAGGVVELVLALQAARAGRVPPIARHATPDDDCRLSLVSGSARALPAAAPSAVCLARSWFGQCTALAVRAAPDPASAAQA
jgi:3-oxoacyl-(acyl-carrier-protein) synthase